MYTFEEVLASGYYVFREKLTTDVISSFLGIMNCLNIKTLSNFSKNEELRRIFEFDYDTFSYKLNSNYNLNDLKEFIKEDLVIVFQELYNLMYKGKQLIKK